jgi:hypothetical protein
MRLDRFAKRFPQPVQKIEDKCFFDLDFLFRTLERVDLAGLAKSCEDPTANRDSEEREKNGRPHDD